MQDTRYMFFGKNKNCIEECSSEKKKIKKDAERQIVRNAESKGIDFFVELFKTVALAILIVVPIKVFVMQPFFVQGASMEPNFHDGDYLIVKEFGYKKTVVAAGSKEFFTVKPSKNVERGEIIVFRNPHNQNQFFIKRVIGLPGEKVIVGNGVVRIYNNESPEGFILDEKKYLPANIKTTPAKVIVAKNNEYVVFGDNRGNSSDSRYWGALKQDLIIGKVVLRAWPITDFKLF
jgi:signal peptidase I